MNIRENLIFGLLAILLLIVDRTNAFTHQSCNRSCPNPASFGGDRLPYPFGCSAGCEIQLNCSKAGIFIGEFPIQSINSESIRINLQSQCDRPLHTLHQLYSNNHAPTSRNAILLRNCIDEQVSSSCVFPSINVEARFQAPQDCSQNTSLTCYAEVKKNATFLEYGSVEKKGCKYLLSSISAQILNISTQVVPSVTLDVEVAELLWWLPGVCKCDIHAKCITVWTPNGTVGYRCNCTKGFIGDGFRDGFGCLKGDQICTLKIGLGVAAGVVALVVVSCCYFWEKKRQDRLNVEAFLRNYGPLQVKRYSYSNVKKITNSFKKKLGQGGYGGVYEGELKDGRLVAVKVLNRSKGNGEEFMNEVAAISRTSHVNIVSLLGFCFEGSKRALIYEFMPNGSLEKFIFDANNSQKVHHLGWEALERISLGIARGLEYLHRGCNTRILHFDIKPHNILLDENFLPKISDFGLAKICDRKESNVSMLCARGTAGYIAPEVFCRNFGGVSHKSDVYSYGMMLSEMVGRRRNINVEVEDTSEIYFPHWIYKRLELDEELGLQCVTNEDKSRGRKMIIVSLWCIQTDPSNRPAMKEVIEMLEGSVESLKIPPKPYLSSPPNSLQ